MLTALHIKATLIPIRFQHAEIFQEDNVLYWDEEDGMLKDDWNDDKEAAVINRNFG